MCSSETTNCCGVNVRAVDTSTQTVACTHHFLAAIWVYFFLCLVSSISIAVAATIGMIIAYSIAVTVLGIVGMQKRRNYECVLAASILAVLSIGIGIYNVWAGLAYLYAADYCDAHNNYSAAVCDYFRNWGTWMILIAILFVLSIVYVAVPGFWIVSNGDNVFHEKPCCACNCCDDSKGIEPPRRGPVASAAATVVAVALPPQKA